MQEKVKDALGSEYTIVGTRPLRPDGVDKVTGRAKFGADLAMQGQLVGKVLRSPHPHARIKSIDASAALKLTGDNRATAAEMLGLSRQSLYVKLRRFGLADASEYDDENKVE